jgi:hypothetical protein
MSIGAYIMTQVADNDAFEALPADLECAVTEIRVEQHLSKPTTFAIRFQEDFEDGEGATITSDKLRGAKGIAIAVSSGPGQPPRDGKPVLPKPEQLACLVRGQIENSQADISMAAAGSWFEVRGRDVRTILDRLYEPKEFPDKTQDIVNDMLQRIAPSGEIEVDESVTQFVEKGHFMYVGTVLDGLERVATLCGYSMWLDYDLKASVRRDAHYEVVVNANIKTSPSRDDEQSPTDIDLVASDELKAYLRVIGTETQCENVLNFSLKTDNEATANVSTASVDFETGEARDIDGQQSDRKDLTPDKETVQSAGADPSERGMFMANAGPLGRAEGVTRAAANEAAWYVKANALTTVHMLGTILQPHDLVAVIGGGCGINGGFQVEKVTHVINAAAHWMHLELRSNSRSLEHTAEGILDV